MHRVIQILSVFLLLTLASAANGQTPSACGIVDIDGPSEVEHGKPLVLKAKVTGIHTTKPEFKWWVSLGTITKGQGTDEITVDTAGLGGMVVTATVGLSGAPLGCTGAASKTLLVEKPAVIGCRFDEYGDIKFEDEKARLDNFAITLANEPLTSAQILVSAGQETFEGEAAERLARAKSYLADVREIDPGRIVTVDCGFSQDLIVQLFVVPVGAALAACNDSRAVPFFEVKFTKPRPKSSKKPR